MFWYIDYFTISALIFTPVSKVVGVQAVWELTLHRSSMLCLWFCHRHPTLILSFELHQSAPFLLPGHCLTHLWTHDPTFLNFLPLLRIIYFPDRHRQSLLWTYRPFLPTQLFYLATSNATPWPSTPSGGYIFGFLTENGIAQSHKYLFRWLS